MFFFWIIVWEWYILFYKFYENLSVFFVVSIWLGIEYINVNNIRIGFCYYVVNNLVEYIKNS